MGMDVIGKAPTSDTGEYFRNNVWWWRPLARYVCDVAPAITSKCHAWQTNDGDGLGAADAIALAATLERAIAAGETAAYAEAHAAKLAALKEEPCDLCHGTGTRPDGLERFGAEWLKASNGCNGCQGKGTRPNWDSYYPFTVENAQEFVAFLKDCGGFEIR